MDTIDIIKLIEKNHLTRLSKEYENTLLTKIKDNFTENQQQLFVSSFYCYLNNDTKKDFVIDFDNIWKWVGFSRKDHAKTCLKKYFVINIDYIVRIPAPPTAGTGNEDNNCLLPRSREQTNNNIGGVENNNRGGANKEQIIITVNTFKKFCLKAGTDKANEIHDYYIKLEELLQETINEESNELRKQLLYKETEIEEQNSKIAILEKQNKSLTKHVVRKYSDKYKLGNCVYLISSSEIPDKFKVGSTLNINNRISDLSVGSPYYFEVIKLYYTSFHTLLEKTIKELFAKYRISVNCEWYELKVIDDMKEFIETQLELYNKFENNSSINIVNDIEENIIIVADDKKVCLGCNGVLNLRNFFNIDKKNKIFLDKCISCYDKENGSSKQCFKCNEIKKKHYFVVDRTKKDGLTYECKECRTTQITKRKTEIRKENPNLGKNQCTTCETFEDLKMFYKTKLDDGKVTYSEQCKKCYCNEHGNSKQCFRCQEIKEVSNFDKTTANVDGLACYCKPCRKIKRDKERDEKKEKIDKTENKKQCLKCKEYLEFNTFFKKMSDTNDVISYHDECRTCYTPNSLQCNRCHDIKEVTAFAKDSTKKTGHRTICKKCVNV